MDEQLRVAGPRVDIGADEASCGDVSHPLDWDADGLVNYEEFNAFSRGWLTKDPNVYTVADPNIGDRWFAYGKQCDLSGDSEIDLDDLEELFEERFIDSWLWIACWKEGEFLEAIPLSGSGESMAMSQSLFMESMLSAPVLSEAATPSAEALVEVIGFVESVIENDAPANAEALLDLVAYLEDELKAIRKENK